MELDAPQAKQREPRVYSIVMPDCHGLESLGVPYGHLTYDVEAGTWSGETPADWLQRINAQVLTEMYRSEFRDGCTGISWSLYRRWNETHGA
jgi:hypothetical protein